MSLNPYGKFWSSVQKFSTAIVLCMHAYEISLRIGANFSSIKPYCTGQIQSKNVDFCCAIFSCIYLHSKRYKKLYIKRRFEVILHHIGGETGTKHRIVERCVFNRRMAAYSIIFNAILHKNSGVSDLGTRRIEFSTVQNVSLYQNIHPIRTLYPNKIIVSNKLLGLLGLGSGLGSG